MVITTRAQRVALKRVFDRTPLYRFDEMGVPALTSNPRYMGHQPISYREFRRGVAPGYDCIMLRWCGMWLGIEPDGYTHS